MPNTTAPRRQGSPRSRGPTIGEAAEYLNTRHHSVVGLVDRAERGGMLRRVRDVSDARIVRLQLSEQGEDRIAQLSELHLVELTASPGPATSGDLRRCRRARTPHALATGSDPGW